ncbi:hypothetical protein OF83DRAFT_1038421, partial [Amylostereum chailletii]
IFSLRAYLILAFGDIPAVSLLMRMKGHNDISPCRICKIIGVRVPNTNSTAHYVPLNRRSGHFPDDNAILLYIAKGLPMRTHNEIIQMATEVEAAPTQAASDRLAKMYGIKGLSIFSSLSSMSLAESFPYDFMHLIWENTIKNLVLLWTGKFKGLDEGIGSYELSSSVWDAIGAATSSAG